MNSRLPERNLGYKPPPHQVSAVYLFVSEESLRSVRLRRDSGETVSQDEMKDFFDATGSIHDMLAHYGGWYTEKNVDGELARYDERWMNVPGSETRVSLISLLRKAREKFTHKNSNGEQGEDTSPPPLRS